MKPFRVFIFLLSQYVYSDVQAQITFQKTYTTSPDDPEVTGFDLTDDGGYIITGCYYYGPQGYNVDIFLLKTDSAGSINWYKKISNDSAGFAPLSGQQTNDGGYILTGVIMAPFTTNDLFLLKTDASGTVLWNKRCGDWLHSGGIETIQTNDGGYIIMGYSGLINFGALSYTYLIKTDSLGNEMWNTAFDSVYYDFKGKSIRQTDDGGYMVLGDVHNGLVAPYTEDIFLAKFNPMGTLLWCKDYNMLEDELSYSFEQTNDGGFIISGAKNDMTTLTYYDILIFKTDSAGTVEWSRSYGGTGHDLGLSVKQTMDGGYSLACEVSSQSVLIKTDSAGDILWAENYGSMNYQPAFHRQTNDSGFILAGSSYQFPPDRSIYLIKTDAIGNSGCNESPISIPLLPSLVVTNTVTPYVDSISIPLPPDLFTPINVSATTTICIPNIVNEKPSDDYLKVYPNPSPGDFVFEVKLANKETVSVEIFDVVGKMILSQTNDHSPFTIKNSQLTNGVYSAVVVAGENKKAIKIVKIDR